MSEHFNEMNSPSELTPLAEGLKALVPAPTTLSRDRLLFEAGRAAAAPRLAWLWPACTFGFAVATALLAVFVVWSDRPPQTVVVERERIVEVRVGVPVEKPIELSPAPRLHEVTHEDEGISAETVKMYQVRRDVLQWGVAMLPGTKPARKVSLSSQNAGDLERWLEVPTGTFVAPPAKQPRFFPAIKGDD